MHRVLNQGLFFFFFFFFFFLERIAHAEPSASNYADEGEQAFWFKSCKSQTYADRSVQTYADERIICNGPAKYAARPDHVRNDHRICRLRPLLIQFVPWASNRSPCGQLDWREIAAHHKEPDNLGCAIDPRCPNKIRQRTI